MTTVTKDVCTVMETRAHIESMIAGFNDHDLDQIMKYFTADVVWEDPALPAVAVGMREAREAAASVLHAFPDMHFDPKRLEIFVAPDGKTAMSSWAWVGTMRGRIDPPGYPATNKRVELRGACRYHLKNGLISHHVVIYDVLGLLQQLGLMPAGQSFGVRAMAGAQRLRYEFADKARQALHH